MRLTIDIQMVLTKLERNHMPLIYKGFSLECCSSSVIGLSWNVKFVETIHQLF